MCIVIDTNTFSSVFTEDSHDHHNFKPVNQWVTKGKGFIVYGGSTYKSELRAASRYLRFFSELERAGKVILIVDDVVDSYESKVKRHAESKGCDDCHLIAIFRASECKLLCSKDKRADRYIKNRSFYLAGQSPPSVYRQKGHKFLLSDRNIVAVKNRSNISK